MAAATSFVVFTMISFACSACGQTYTVPNYKAGKAAKCKRCGKTLTVPDDSEPDWVDEAASPSSRRAGRVTKTSIAKRFGVWMGIYSIGAVMGLTLLWAILFRSTGSRDKRPGLEPVGPPPPPPVAAPLSDEDTARDVVRRWLDDLKRGGHGDGYWSSTEDVVYGRRLRLNSVRSYTILSTKVGLAEPDVQRGFTAAVRVVVQIDYSDSAGRPVTQNYRLTVAGSPSYMCLRGAV